MSILMRRFVWAPIQAIRYTVMAAVLAVTMGYAWLPLVAHIAQSQRHSQHHCVTPILSAKIIEYILLFPIKTYTKSNN